MKNDYLETFKNKLEGKQTPKSLHNLIESTNFFFKVLKVKLESQDPEMMGQAVDELRQMHSILKDIDTK